MDAIVHSTDAMNAIELLKQQHREVDELFARFEKSKRTNEKEKLFLEIAARLVAHDAIEREIFYPACEKVLGEDEHLMEGIAEHGLVEFSIFRADKARGKPTFEYLVTVFKEMVEHHVEEEEKEILPKVSKKMSNATLERLGEAMLARFEEAMSHDFRPPLRANLQQVLGGRVKTVPKRSARSTPRKRTTSASTRRRTGARTKRATGAKRGAARSR
jgi:hemerythrin superfamily protein